MNNLNKQTNAQNQLVQQAPQKSNTIMIQQQVEKPSKDNITSLAEQGLSSLILTNQMADEANLNIHGQGQQLERINDQLNDNQNKLGKIAYIQRNIKSFSGQIRGLFTNPKKVNLEKDNNQFHKPIEKPQALTSNIQPKISEQNTIPVNSRSMTEQEQKKNALIEQIYQQSLQLHEKQLLQQAELTKQSHQTNHIGTKIDNQKHQMDQINKTSKQIK